MIKNEYFIAGIRSQHERLGALIRQLETAEQLDREDCDRYEKTTKEVEQNLRKLRKVVTDELVKEIRILNREELAE